MSSVACKFILSKAGTCRPCCILIQGQHHAWTAKLSERLVPCRAQCNLDSFAYAGGSSGSKSSRQELHYWPSFLTHDTSPVDGHSTNHLPKSAFRGLQTCTGLPKSKTPRTCSPYCGASEQAGEADHQSLQRRTTIACEATFS